MYDYRPNNIHAKIIHHADWLRTRQLIPNQCRKLKLSAKVEIECKKLKFNLIDRQVLKVQQNKMAGSSGESDDVLIQSLRENATNKNTLQSNYK